MDGEGVIRNARIPQEAEGMELIEFTKEGEELLSFEGFLNHALEQGYKPISAYYKFEEYLGRIKSALNLVHLKYIQNRLSRLPNPPKEGMWFHIKKDKGLL